MIRVLCFKETWFSPDTPDSHVDLENFRIIRGDRTPESGNSVGGGLCLYVNKGWCHTNNICVKNHLCLPDLDLLAISCRPYYLPREIPCVIFIVVYLPNGPNETNEDIIHNTVSQIQSDKPESAVIVLGDFNDPSFTISNFTQYGACSTRIKKLLICVSLIYLMPFDMMSAHNK